MLIRDKFVENNRMDRHFDEMFSQIDEHLHNGWRDRPITDLHIANIVLQRTLLDYERNSSQPLCDFSFLLEMEIFFTSDDPLGSS